MSDEQKKAEIVADRALVIPGVRRGLLRRMGTLILSADRLIFLPRREGEDESLQRLHDSAGDEAIEAVDAIARVAAADEHGLVLPRGKRGLAPPDEDGRLRLLPVGEEEDLLVPLDACPLLILTMGLRPAPDATSTVALLTGGGMSQEAVDPDARSGWSGPISAGSSAFLTVIVLPSFLLLCLLLVEEVDDELGAVVYLFGAVGMLVLYFVTVAHAGWGFFRREITRMWGISTIPFALISALVLMGLSLFALDELF
jgi:hypothetical protein